MPCSPPREAGLLAGTGGVGVGGGMGGERERVSWCFTPSQPVRLYQGDREREGKVYNKQ